ncbi:hypothetical protein [Phenylobacterium sp. 58.2.17]|uniref:hypothetical protein n=1 Tax=Phenylobacterium sp. 58.2.17 TaxID=2969306 RepID=UPI002263CDB4|nr:hypothetical protein [Phenylobacterium sp. 58.2.17]MCX7585613.1 hypothetical protein [Phenylobacterium sp. 58.2.17]
MRNRLMMIAAGGGIVLAAGAMLATSVSLSPGRPGYGAVVALLSVETEQGAVPGAWVIVGERRVRVTLNRGSGCVVGDRIALVEHKMLLGRRYVAGIGGCSTPTLAEARRTAWAS